MKLLLLILFGLSIVLHTTIILAQDKSLWQDQDIYSNALAYKKGNLIQIIFNEKDKTDFSVEIQTDKNNDTTTVPDKKMSSELAPYASSYSFVGNNKGKYKTSGNLKGFIQAIITEIDPVSGNISLEGSKQINLDGDIKSIRVTGIVSSENISKKSISSDKIANLNIVIRGKITDKNIQNPEIEMKYKTDAEGNEKASAELSENEKQELLLKYLKRILGESE